MLPGRLFSLAARPGLVFDTPSASSRDEIRLQPHYRAQRPLDAILLKAQTGLDDFVTEKYHDQIASILAEWSASWCAAPRDVRAVASVLTSDFLGTSLQPSGSRLVRPGPVVEVHQSEFKSVAELQKAEFLSDLQTFFGVFFQIVTAELQITSIAASANLVGGISNRIETRVRYELVGEGADFHREQRVGYWQMAWEADASSSGRGDFRLQSWQALEETRSRSRSPVFVDIAAAAFGGNSSYAAQMLRGTDYWRSVLDGACGIDIYGHNGVSIADVDGDGFDDLYICQPAGLPNRLYRNRGDGTFEDITEASGLGLLDNTACALFADFDNDGRQDAVIVRASGPVLFLNEGGGKFRRKPDAFQFADAPRGTFTGAAVADYDRDGWLDIYFCLYLFYQGTDQYKYPVPYHDAENGPPNFMMRNNGDGTFRDVTAQSGLNHNNTRYSFCCGWNDYNRDGWPDLYVVNDFGRKNLYRNNGDGTFSDVASEAGVEDIGAGMSVCWSDYDNDGADSLYVGNMWSAAGLRISTQEVFKKGSPQQVRDLYRKHAMGNSLFRNEPYRNGPSRNNSVAFRNTTEAAGVGVGRWAWSSDVVDFDHDGFPDLYIANGMISGAARKDLNSFFWRQVVANSPDEARPAHDYEQGWSAINELIRADGTWSGYERNVFYANNRDGTFSDVSAAVAMDFLEDGRAFAIADFDRDGRQEIFLKNRNAPQLRLLKNAMESLPPSITFHLRGTKSNRDAIGAEITLETASGRQTRTLQAGSGFLSQHSKEIFFGLGETKGPVQASIRWPSGLTQNFHDVPPNHRLWIEEGSDSFRSEPFRVPNPAPGRIERAAPLARDLAAGAAETWLIEPVPAPDFSLPDSSGVVQTLAVLRGKPVLLNFWVTHSADCQSDLKTFERAHRRWRAQGLQLLTVNLDDAIGDRTLLRRAPERTFSFTILRGSDDVAGIYNTVYRYLFDRHRDLGLPTSFLIDAKGQIVKLYQGPLQPEQVERDLLHIPQTDAARLALALPFRGNSETFDFGRNYLSYGSVFFQRGYFDQAAASFQLALHDDPSSAEAMYGLGSAYLNRQETAKARDCFERATNLHAGYPDTLANAWNNLGILAEQENQSEEAIQSFLKALALSPGNLVALNNLGNAYRARKNWDAARDIFERALKISPGDPEANYGLAMVFAQADDTPHAYELLQRALKSRPDYPEALNNLGILYLRTQRRDEAVASFEESIRVAPTFDQAYLNLARVYMIEGAPDKARAVLLQLLKQHPDHAQAQNMLAHLPQ
jgi:tetratricopeptide (TPR) repeat protein